DMMILLIWLLGAPLAGLLLINLAGHSIHIWKDGFFKAIKQTQVGSLAELATLVASLIALSISLQANHEASEVAAANISFLRTSKESLASLVTTAKAQQDVL